MGSATTLLQLQSAAAAAAVRLSSVGWLLAAALLFADAPTSPRVHAQGSQHPANMPAHHDAAEATAAAAAAGQPSANYFISFYLAKI
jgi:hypothetical protein